jgi:hypothetical protein
MYIKLQFFLQVIKPFVICMMMMFFLQMSGFNVMVFYCVTIFHKSGSTIQPNLASIIGRSFYYKNKKKIIQIYDITESSVFSGLCPGVVLLCGFGGGVQARQVSHYTFKYL